MRKGDTFEKPFDLKKRCERPGCNALSYLRGYECRIVDGKRTRTRKFIYVCLQHKDVVY